MSSVSMILSSLGKTVDGASASPKTLNAWLKNNHGYSGNSFAWGAVAKFGLKYQGKINTSSSIHSAIDADKFVILNVNHGGHWVLATGTTATGYSVNDPGYSKTSYANSEVTQAAVFTL